MFVITLFVLLSTNTNAQIWVSVDSPGISGRAVASTCIVVDTGGTIYTVFQDGATSLGNATVKKYVDTGWETVGTAGFSAGEAWGYQWIAIDGNGTPYVSYTDYGNLQKSTVMKYADTAWVPVGSVAFSPVQTDWVSIALNSSGTPYVVYGDFDTISGIQGKASVMMYNGSAWIAVGDTAFSNGPVNYTDIAIDTGGTPYVVFADINIGSAITVMKYTGTGWVNVGARGFSTGGVAYPTIKIDNSGIPYVAYCGYDTGSGSNGPITVMKFNGASWETVGSAGISSGPAQWSTMAIDTGGTVYVAYEDDSTSTYGPATVKKFNGSSWVTVGNDRFSAGAVQFTSIAINANGVPFVCYEDYAYSGKATVMKYLDTALVTNNINHPVAASLSVYPDPNQGAFTVNIASPDIENVKILITDMLGATIKEMTVSTNQQTEMELQAPPGIYFIVAVTKNETLNAKVVVQ